MALANVADRLSRYSLKTLIVDFDLEAPGLERFFPIDMEAARQNRGLLDLLIDYKQAMSQPVGRSTREFQKLEQYIFPIYYQLPGGGSLHLLPAGMRADEDQLSNYAYQLRTFDWQEFYFDWGGALFFQWLSREIDKRYDLALIDSRTGVTEMGGVCAYQLADSLVMFCAPNAQNLQGTRDVLRNFRSERVRALRKDRALQVLVAPARVEQNSPELEKFRAAFAAFDEFAPATLKAMGLSFWDLMVPYDPAFAFEERVAAEYGAASDGALSQAYIRLASVVASMAGEGSKASDAGKRMVAAATSGTGVLPPLEPQYDATTSFAGYDVFVSYQLRDREFVEPLVNALQQSGLSVFIGKSRLAAGDSWKQQWDTAIAQSAAVLVLVGEEMGPNQTQEVVTAIKNGRSIFPVLLPQVSMDRVPEFLKEYHFIDLRAGFNDDSLRSVTDILTGTAKKPSRVAVTEENPYIGLRSFDESDARFFFGRETLVAEAIERLRSNPFLAIIGASGSGKSTLTRAGIIPRLRSEYDDIRMTLVRPFSNPVRELAVGLAETDRSLGGDQVELALREGAPIASLVKPGARLVVVVDQLEELWIVSDRSERLLYLRLLTSAARESSGALTLIVLLRADFYGDTTEDREFSDLLSRNQLLVGRMTREELRLAIEKPAQVNGVSFEPGLVERILEDLEQSTSPLPLLQILLARLWADRRRGFITHESYERCGGLRILSITAEEAYGSLSPDEQSAARIVLLKVVSPQGEGIAVPIEEFSSSERIVSEKLVQHRLLRGTQHYGSGFVELAYKSLIREWDRLAQWVREEREALEFRDRIQHDIERGQNLYRGDTLSQAERWLKDHRELATAEQAGFIRASRRQLLLRRTVAAGCIVVVFFAFFELMYSYRRNLLRVDHWLGQAAVVNYLSPIQKGVIVDQRDSAFILSGLTGTARPIANGVFTAVLSPDARTVAAASRRGSIYVFDALSGATRFTLDPSGNPLSLAISSDGRELAVGNAEGDVYIWSLTDGHRVATAKPNVGPIQTIRFAGHDLLVNGKTEPLQLLRP
jgi:hypothetical protein